MDINTKNAISRFFPHPTFTMIYCEAIANSLDAGANNIQIDINIKSFTDPASLSIKIVDNGKGFIDSRFYRFKELLMPEDKEHKGLGRLVFINYFEAVKILSYYDNSKREFTFNSDFKGKNKFEKLTEDHSNETTLVFKNFIGQKISSYDDLKPESIKQLLLNHFFPLLYEKKEKGQQLNIKIKLDVEVQNKDKDFYSDEEQITIDDLPEFETDSIEVPELLIQKQIKVYYRVKENWSKNKPVSLFCVDNRTVNINLKLEDKIPERYEVFFIFNSEEFSGQVDDSRQNLKLKNQEDEKNLLNALKDKISEILESKIPEIKKKNDATKKYLENRYPHLLGYFERTVGIINKENALEDAQKKFFKAQKEILECGTLDDNKYEKALDISSRLLAEYILYRTIIINKLKDIDINNSESDIHNLIVPQYEKFIKDNAPDDLYRNNVWLLDDKYMSYNAVLSERDMSEVIKAITLEEDVKSDCKRPDITIVFSKDPETSEFVDVIVVELKKKGIKLAQNEEVFSQLKQRARKLLKYYPGKIERIWFYGITEIDQEFRRSLLEDDFKELFSHGQMFYKYQPIIVDNEDTKVLADMYILSYDTFINDAESRNRTFLEVLKDGIKKSVLAHEKVKK